MDYPISIQGLEGQKIAVRSPGMFSGPVLLINGQPAQKGQKRGEMLVRRNDGRVVTAAWKQKVFGLDLPQIVVDGKPIDIVDPLPWYVWAWAGLPFLLVFSGGAIGGGIGAVGAFLNLKIFRSSMSGVLKYLIAAAISAGAFIAYLAAAILVQLAIS